VITGHVDMTREKLRNFEIYITATS